MTGAKLLPLVIFVSAPAVAQTTQCMANGPFVNCNGSDGSFTTCNRTGAIVNCNTTGGNQAVQQAAPDNGMVGFAGAIRRIRENKLRSHVGKALQAGDCPTAMREALKLGDMDYALQVKSYCEQR